MNELARYPKGNWKQDVLTLVGIVGGIAALGVVSILLTGLGVPFADIIVFLMIVTWACALYFQRIVQYRYVLGEDAFTVLRKSGEHEREMLSIPLGRIEDVGEVDESCKLPTEKLRVPTRKLRTVQVIYVEKEERRRVLVQISEAFAQALREGAGK